MKQMKAVEIRQARGPLQLVERDVSSDTAGTLDEVKKPGVFKKAERSSARPGAASSPCCASRDKFHYLPDPGFFSSLSGSSSGASGGGA